MLVHESDSTLGNEGVHRKLVHEKWTGPWTVTAVITPGLCYQVVLNGRQIRERKTSASHLKPYHVRPVGIRHDFGDEYSHFAWEADLGQTLPSMVASPLYTLVDRSAVSSGDNSWKWRYTGKLLIGMMSDWFH